MRSVTFNNVCFRYRGLIHRVNHQFVLSVYITILSVIAPNSFAQAPDLFLLKPYQESKNIIGWVMSEKLDGVRAYWDGRQLISRGGLVFNAPEEFTQDFPAFALDGELWTKRNDFENIVSIVRQQQPDERWSQITYRVFEVPQQSGGLLERLAVLQSYLISLAQKLSNRKIPDQNAASSSPEKYRSTTEKLIHLSVIPQIEIKTQAQLDDFFQQVVSQGAEGVVVRNPVTLYQTGRLNDALKVKPYQDAECEVIGYSPGRGKYQGLVGAIKCLLDDQKVIKVGSGLSDMQRRNPPIIGSIITFKYFGLTGKGLPRFPVFLRLRMSVIDGQ